MPRTMPSTTEWLRAAASGRAIGVDREAKVIHGYVVAQLGPFKTPGRGQFDAESLRIIERLMTENGPAGTKSRFTHPDMSNDGLGTFLGRGRQPRIDGDKVRADLHLDPSSFDTPKGNLGKYILDLAASDPDALSSSLVLKADKVEVLDEAGRPKLDEKGAPLPPLWRPTIIHASDIVDYGDAVDGLLSAGVDVDGLPLAALWRGAEMLDQVFAGQTREAVEARCLGFLEKYLTRRYGEADDYGIGEATRVFESTLRRRRLRLLELAG